MMNNHLSISAFNHFPLKHGVDAMALGRLFLRRDLSLAQKANSLQFYLHPSNVRNLYATLTRCGSHWSILSLSVAMDLARGGNGDYWFETESWHLTNGTRYMKLDWRVPLGEIEKAMGTTITDPVLFHSHHPYRRIRTLQLKNMKTVVVLRNILESMESKFFKLGKVPDNPDQDDDENFPWKKMIDDAIEFYNSWGEAIRWHPHCLVFKYEDLMADPVTTHMEMSRHWGLEIPRECLQEAFRLTTKEAMRNKFMEAGISKQTRVSYRSEESDIPETRKKAILKRIHDNLVYDFGYDFR